MFYHDIETGVLLKMGLPVAHVTRPDAKHVNIKFVGLNSKKVVQSNLQCLNSTSVVMGKNNRVYLTQVRKSYSYESMSLFNYNAKACWIPVKDDSIARDKISGILPKSVATKKAMNNYMAKMGSLKND